ncbi:putative ribonuclease H-like domain-containing protein [Tanacetum coccineum]|uniref:Ribonuclease H-like domain-containing protein n=1 Tax=Tanacetum coccineum TaxID=301880 RepID=A0ABQ4ZBH8_9ASTR
MANSNRKNVNPVRPTVNIGSSNVNTVRSRQPVPTKTSNSFSPKRLQENWGSAVKTSDHPLKNMVDRGIFDSGCSGHMTCNKDQLEDFEEFNGGSVTFGGSKGYISDNGTEFKNRDMLEFCGNKGIKQEYINAITPQHNGVAERMNRTLIEAARTMLADSLLPTTFWAEAVSTACYIFNRVRVTKPQNKTPYELLFGHKPIISYIRPFGCHVTILDTLSVLGKFDGKSDEGFLVGYSLNSKAYRVYNLVTKRVEVNLHVNFLEDKPNVKGVGYRWMFDIDYLTDSMNYIPVSLENQANPHAGASEVTNSAGTSQTPSSNASEEKDEDVELIFVPSAVKNTKEKVESRTSSTNSKKEILALRRELEEIALKHLGTVYENNSTNTPSVNTGNESVNTGRFDPDDSPMPELEIFTSLRQEFLMRHLMMKRLMQEECYMFKLQQVWVSCRSTSQKAKPEILKKFDLVNVKTAITPMESKVALIKDEEAVDVDVTPKTSHLNAVKRIFKYLKGKLHLGLWYPRESPFDLEAFSDSDYSGSNLDRKSTTSGCQFLGQRLISWQ